MRWEKAVSISLSLPVTRLFFFFVKMMPFCCPECLRAPAVAVENALGGGGLNSVGPSSGAVRKSHIRGLHVK